MKRKRKIDPTLSYEEAHALGKAQGSLQYRYELAVKCRDAKILDLPTLAKWTELSIKTILVL